MDTSLSTDYAVIQIDLARLSAHAERGWVAEQAPARDHGTLTRLACGRWVGPLMILADRRIQGGRQTALQGIQPGVPA